MPVIRNHNGKFSLIDTIGFDEASNGDNLLLVPPRLDPFGYEVYFAIVIAVANLHQTLMAD